MRDLRTFILDYTSFDDEPLHLVISSAIASGSLDKPDDIVGPLIELAREGLITIRFHSGLPYKTYEVVSVVEQSTIAAYIERNRMADFTTYPEEGGEYYVRAVAP